MDRQATFKGGFWCGVLVANAAHILFTDLLGLEGYIAHLRDYWVSAWIGIPLALVALVLAAVLAALHREAA